MLWEIVCKYIYAYREVGKVAVGFEYRDRKSIVNVNIRVCV